MCFERIARKYPTGLHNKANFLSKNNKLFLISKFNEIADLLDET